MKNSTYADKGRVWGGNTCDTMLKLGQSGFATFGGDTAEAVARRDWNLK